MTEQLIFDTYAIIEILQNNYNYSKYLDDIPIINQFIYAELCYKLQREKMQGLRKCLANWGKFIETPTPDTIELAMKFRLENRTRNLSIPDCIGYIMAKKLGIRFLTGDKQFQGMTNVEYVN